MTAHELPGEPTPTRRIVVGVAALFFFVGVGASAYFLAGGGTETEVARATPTSTASTGAVGPNGGVSTAAEARTVDILGLAFELPPGWVVAAPGAGVTGSQLVDDPEVGELFDVLQAQQAASTVLFGLDSDLESETTLNVVIESVPADAGFEALVASGRAGFVAQPTVVLTVDDDATLAGSDGHVFRYRFESAGRQAHGLQFLVQNEGQVYIVTFTSIDERRIDDLVGTGDSFAPA